MSVDSGGGSTEGWRMPGAPGGTGQPILASLHETYAAYLFDYCEGILRDPAAATEAVQQTLTVAGAEAGQLRDPDRIPVQLYDLARRQCLDGPPGRFGTPAASQFAAEQTAAAATANAEITEAEAGALEQETQRIVQAALDGLPDRDREVLNLAFRHGFGVADLAEVLGVSPRRARRLLSRASRRFEKSAAVAAALCVGYGWAACPALESSFGWWDSASPPLTPRLRRRFARHVRSCERCAENRETDPRPRSAQRHAARGTAGRAWQLIAAMPSPEPDACPAPAATASTADGRLGGLDAEDFPASGPRAAGLACGGPCWPRPRPRRSSSWPARAPCFISSRRRLPPARVGRPRT